MENRQGRSCLNTKKDGIPNKASETSSVRPRTASLNRLNAIVVHYEMKRILIVLLASSAILAGVLALFYTTRGGFRMYVLTDEFQAPIALEAMLREHGPDSDIPLKSDTVQHLANLIRRLDHSLLVQKVITGALSLVCVALGSVTLFTMRKKGCTTTKSTLSSEAAPSAAPSER